jgi:hypothetical protein
MAHKQISTLFLSIIMCFLVSNNCQGQIGYVVFGDNTQMCSGTGICSAQNASTPVACQRGGQNTALNPTLAFFIVANNVPQNTFTVTMFIDFMALSFDDPISYGLFQRGNYNCAIGTIPANVLNNNPGAGGPNAVINGANIINLVLPPIGQVQAGVSNYQSITFGPFPGQVPAISVALRKRYSHIMAWAHGHGHHKPSKKTDKK